MDIRRFLGLMWARILIVVAVTAQVALIAFLVSGMLPPTYEAQASLVVQAGLGTGDASNDDILTAPRIGQTYAGLAMTRPVLEGLIEELALPYSVPDLAAQLAVNAEFDSPFLAIVARDEDPERAAAIANGLAEALVELSTRAPAVDAAPQALLSIVDPAQVPDERSSPRVLFNTVLAAGAAFALTIALLSVLAYLDDRIRRSSDLEGVPAALLGRVRLDAEPSASAHGFTQSLETGEAVFTGLVNHLLPGTGRVSLTSPSGGRGAGVTAASLAIAAAHLGRRTVLIDANLREPYLHVLFETDNQTGLGTLLGGTGAAVATLLRSTHVSGLRLLPAGPVLGDPEDLLTSRHMAEVLGQLAADADLVVVATPPTGTTSDAMLVSALVDSTILVVNQGTTTRGQLHAAIAGMRGVGGRILGLVLIIPRTTRGGSPGDEPAPVAERSPTS